MSTTNTAVYSSLVSETGVAALLSDDPIIACMDKSTEKDFEQKTYQSGDTVYVRLEDQPQMAVQSNVMNMDPVIQREVAVTALIYNNGVPLPSVEYEYFLGGKARVQKNILKPRMKGMAATAYQICYNSIAKCMNYFGTAGTDLTSGTLWAPGKAILTNQLALPSEGLYGIMSEDTMSACAADLAKYFQPSKDVATAYLEGVVKEAMGLNFFSTSLIPNHANGTAVGSGTTGFAVGTNVTTGATTIAASGGTSAGTLTEGSLIWFSGAAQYAVQPQTKKNLSTKRYFCVDSLLTLSGGAGTITVTAAIYGPENPKLQNISALPTTASYIGIVGTASHTYEQAIVMRKGAAGFVNLRLPDLFNFETSRSEIEGIEICSTIFADGTNRLNMVRWDGLWGALRRQELHIARAFTRDLGSNL